jgi:hypothetical protein
MPSCLRARVPRSSSAFRAAGLLAVAAAVVGLAGCSLASSPVEYPAADLKPPDLLAAGPASSREVVLRFDEEVKPVAGSFSTQPEASLEAAAEGGKLSIAFGSAQSAGADYSLVGEVEDGHGNRTRFLVRFTGWNDRAPPLRISEVLPCKNSSTAKPHRDFVELEVLEDGNLGGEELSWANSVKTAIYRFPSVEVRKGDFVVLHLSPEGLPDERDETGADLSISGGADATATGRDFWCGSLALPDSSGCLALALRPGAPPMDGLFYADDGKSGPLGDNDIADLLSELSRAGAWPLSGSAPAWSDGLPWSGSSSKSICRSAIGTGPASWRISASGGQSPGTANPAAAASAPAVSATVEASAGELKLKAVKASKGAKAAKAPKKAKAKKRKAKAD